MTRCASLRHLTTEFERVATTRPMLDAPAVLWGEPAAGASNIVVITPALRRFYNPPLRLDPPDHALGHLTKPRHPSDPTSVSVCAAFHAPRLALEGDAWRAAGRVENCPKWT